VQTHRKSRGCEIGVSRANEQGAGEKGGRGDSKRPTFLLFSDEVDDGCKGSFARAALRLTRPRMVKRMVMATGTGAYKKHDTVNSSSSAFGTILFSVQTYDGQRSTHCPHFIGA
jgi:hypothetical protein